MVLWHHGIKAGCKTRNLRRPALSSLDVSDVRVRGTCHEFPRVFTPRDDGHGDYFELEPLHIATASLSKDEENPCSDRPSMEMRPGKGITEGGDYSPWAMTPPGLECPGAFVPTISILPHLVLPCSANQKAL